jgi:hypothetical protein
LASPRRHPAWGGYRHQNGKPYSSSAAIVPIAPTANSKIASSPSSTNRSRRFAQPPEQTLQPDIAPDLALQLLHSYLVQISSLNNVAASNKQSTAKLIDI